MPLIVFLLVIAIIVLMGFISFIAIVTLYSTNKYEEFLPSYVTNLSRLFSSVCPSVLVVLTVPSVLSVSVVLAVLSVSSVLV